MRLLLLISLPLSSFGQSFFEGLVINKETKHRIPFATIGLIKQNTGTNADENGNFTLSISGSSDTLLISCIGFETTKFPQNRSYLKDTFELQPKIASLAEIIVTNRKNPTSTTLGQYSNCSTNYYTTSNAINQIARHFKTTRNNVSLKEIEICKYGMAIIDPARTKFRIRIYSMDKISGTPGDDLCDSVIELDVTGRHIKVNLEQYNIIIPDTDFFVAIEWLRIPLNQQKNKSKIDGNQKFVYYTYSPLIAIKDETKESLDFECWQLEYSGKWRRFPWTAMISATIDY